MHERHDQSECARRTEEERAIALEKSHRRLLAAAPATPGRAQVVSPLTLLGAPAHGGSFSEPSMIKSSTMLSPCVVEGGAMRLPATMASGTMPMALEDSKNAGLEGFWERLLAPSQVSTAQKAAPWTVPA